jgi:aspartyl-tRNA(Asn)/glutamyl-tRNA(Gln) amidotransferase subunit B
VEIKNLNSIRSLYRAVQYEEARHRAALSAGEPLIQETRHWDEDRGVTTHGRSKEYAFDYRYFPEPDLAPLEPDAAWIERVRAELPELPSGRRVRLERDLGLEPAMAARLASDPQWSGFFEATVALGAEPRAAANWLTGDLAGLLNESKEDLAGSKVTPQHVADLARLAGEGAVSSAGAKAALAEAFATGASIESIVEAKGLRQVSDATALEAVIDEVIAENPGPVEQIRKGKDGAVNALVGQVMKKTKGSANPAVAGDLIRSRLAAE